MSISELKEMDIPSLKYMCMMVWHKPNGPNPFGCPTYNMEPILVAKRGRPQFLDTKDFRTTNLWEAPGLNPSPRLIPAIMPVTYLKGCCYD